MRSFWFPRVFRIWIHWMKVGEQVAGGKERASLEKGRKALGRYGLDKEVDQMYPFELSGGMARRVLIGTAVVEQPQLVIADEPTPGLHLEAAVRVLSHFREIADQGAGVLLITHDLELAFKDGRQDRCFLCRNCSGRGSNCGL